MFLVGLCAVVGVLTAFLVGYRRFPNGLTPPTPQESGESGKQRPMRSWKEKTIVFRRQHPDGTTDEIIRHETEGRD